MKTRFSKSILAFALLAVVVSLSACGNSSSGGGSSNGPAAKVNPNHVNWESVSSDFNPNIETAMLSVGGVERIDLDLFGSNVETNVVYDGTLPAGTGVLKMYTVYFERATWGALATSTVAGKMKVGHTGSYQCSIKSSNGTITALKGGCYVRFDLALPVGAEIEVYSESKLISKRFKPMLFSDFMNDLDDASFDKEKFAVIDQFLASYTEASKTPSLTSKQVGEIVGEFSFFDGKIEALRRVQAFVSDRDGLAKMIDDKFNVFDRNKARAVVGLPADGRF